MAAKPETTESPLQLTVATAERRKVKMESPLFYILPPLVVAAVFVYCMVGTPDIPPPAPAPAAVAPQEELDAADFTDDELAVDDADASAEDSGSDAEDVSDSSDAGAGDADSDPEEPSDSAEPSADADTSDEVEADDNTESDEE